MPEGRHIWGIKRLFCMVLWCIIPMISVCRWQNWKPKESPNHLYCSCLQIKCNFHLRTLEAVVPIILLAVCLITKENGRWSDWIVYVKTGVFHLAPSFSGYCMYCFGVSQRTGLMNSSAELWIRRREMGHSQGGQYCRKWWFLSSFLPWIWCVLLMFCFLFFSKLSISDPPTKFIMWGNILLLKRLAIDQTSWIPSYSVQ